MGVEQPVKVWSAGARLSCMILQIKHLKLNIISWKQSIQWVDIILFVLLVLVTSTITTLYVLHEHFFYYWDLGGYQGVTIDQAYGFLKSPLNEIRLIKASLSLDYNYLFTIPLTPFILLFGSSRISYVLSVALIYQMPFALATGALANKLIHGKKRAIFWSTAFLVLLTPIVWAPVLRGYPDTGSILLLALAALVYIQDVKLKRPWQIGLIGFLIAAAVIYRRYFAYSGAAFYESMSVIALSSLAIKMRQSRKWAWKDLLGTATKIGLTGFISFLTLYILGKPLLIKMLTTNYDALYASYMLSPAEIAKFFLSQFGWITWILVIAGYLASISWRVMSHPEAYFIILFGGLSLFQWIFFVRQSGVHYTLQTNLFIVLGLAAFFWTFWSLPHWTLRGISILTLAFLILNFLVTLIPIGLPAPLVTWFSAPYPPLVRNDYNEVARLIDYLRNVVPSGEPIYVVDSSDKMNFDIIRFAERQLYGWDENKLNILSTPQIDSRDYYPLEQLLQSDYVIVTTPFQHHLTPKEQKVAQVVFTAFTQNWEIARDFEMLPGQFNLSGQATLRIYRRIHPTSRETSIRAFSAMQKYIGERPGGQPNWILINQPSPISVIPKSNQIYHIRLNIDPARLETTSALLLYAGALVQQATIAGTIKVEGEQCPGASIGIKVYTDEAQITNSYQQTFTPSSRADPFSFEVEARGTNYLIISVSSFNREGPGGNCMVNVNWKLAGR
jgi:hypothetical protein